MNKRGGGQPLSINQMANIYTTNEPDRREFVERLQDICRKAFHNGVNARDRQLAERFPMHCGFLIRTRIKHPEATDEQD